MTWPCYPRNFTQAAGADTMVSPGCLAAFKTAGAVLCKIRMPERSSGRCVSDLGIGIDGKAIFRLVNLAVFVRVLRRYSA